MQSEDQSNNVPAPVKTDEVASQTPIAPKKKKRGLILGLGIGIPVLLLAIGGGVWAYVWNNSPDKILSDALNNLSSKEMTRATVGATVSTDSGLEKTDISVNLESKTDALKNSQTTVKVSVAVGSTKVENLTLDGIYDKDGNLYVKAEELSKALRQLGSTGDQALIMSLYSSLASKVEGQWIKISAEEISKYQDQMAENSKCDVNKILSIVNSKDNKKELVNAIVKTKYITAKAITQEGADKNIQSYQLSTDGSKLKEFKEAVMNTSFSKQIEECSDGESSSSDSESDIKDPISDFNMILHVDKGSRTVSGLDVETPKDAETQVKVTATFNNSPQTVAIPTETKDINELMQELQSSSSVRFSANASL